MSEVKHTPTNVSPFFVILFLLGMVVTGFICPFNHNDNAIPANVIRNDDFAKMGGSSYSPNHESDAPKVEATAPATEEATKTGEETAKAGHEAAPAHVNEAPKKEATHEAPKGH